MTGGSDREERPIVDVALLVEDIVRRAEARRRRGVYDAALIAQPFDLDGSGEVPSVDTGPIRLRPQLGYSSKPGVGRIITLVKRVSEKLVHHVMQDGFDQAALRIEHVGRHLEDAERRSEQRAEQAVALSRTSSERDSRRRAALSDERERLLEAVASLEAVVTDLAERVQRLESRDASVVDRRSGS